MPLKVAAAPVETAETPNILPWIILLIVAAGAAIGIVVAKKKKKTAV